MKKHILPFILFTLIGLLTSCDENFTIESEKLEKVDFKKLKTYAWIPSIDSISVGGVDRYQLLNAIITNVDDQFFRRGISLDTVKPDILVRYFIRMNNTTALVSTPIYENRPAVSYGMGYGPYGGYGSIGVYSQQVQVGQTISQVPYRNGQLVIEVIETSSSKIIWRGIAYGSREETYTTAAISEMRKKVQRIINDMFWKYPVRKG